MFCFAHKRFNKDYCDVIVMSLIDVKFHGIIMGRIKKLKNSNFVCFSLI